jgi:hypothetical protein
MDDSAEGLALRNWLLSLIPGAEDEEEIGIGAWHRTADDRIIRRHLDIRQFTPESQRLFQSAALKAARRCAESSDALGGLEARESLVDLGDMVIVRIVARRRLAVRTGTKWFHQRSGTSDPVGSAPPTTLSANNPYRQQP